MAAAGIEQLPAPHVPDHVRIRRQEGGRRGIVAPADGDPGKAPAAPPLPESDEWLKANLLPGETITARTKLNLRPGFPLRPHRLLTRKLDQTETVIAAGLLPVAPGDGIYRIDLAAWSGSSSHIHNAASVTFGLFEESDDADAATRTDDPARVIVAASLELRQRAPANRNAEHADRLVIVHRQDDGDIGTRVVTGLIPSPSTIPIASGGGRATAMPARLIMQIESGHVQFRVVSAHDPARTILAGEPVKMPAAARPRVGLRLTVSGPAGQTMNLGWNHLTIPETTTPAEP